MPPEQTGAPRGTGIIWYADVDVAVISMIHSMALPQSASSHRLPGFTQGQGGNRALTKPPTVPGDDAGNAGGLPDVL